MIQVQQDPITYVQQRAERFFTSGSVNAVELATQIIGEVLLLGGYEACAIRDDAWWVIGSNVDWLGNHPDYSAKELFCHIVAFPEAGANSMRAEILLMAFAQDVITKGAEGQVVIKGKVEASAKVWRLIDSRPGWKRAVAFCLAS
jgi:hypothetical protein